MSQDVTRGAADPYELLVLPDGTHITLANAEVVTGKLEEGGLIWEPTDDTEDFTGLALPVHPNDSPPFIPDRPIADSLLAGCTETTEVVREETDYIRVGEYHANRDIRGWFSYSQRADSNLGVGFSYDNAKWGVKGAAYVNNALYNNFKLNRGPNYGRTMRSRFYYEKEHMFMQCPEGGHHYFWLTGKSWEGGLKEGKDVSGMDTQEQMLLARARDERNAYGIQPDGEWDRFNSEGTKYSGGVSIMGIDLNAQSGYTTNVGMYWKTGSEIKNHWVFHPSQRVVESKRVYSW